MKSGVDYKIYVREIAKAVRAWEICRQWFFTSEIPVKVLIDCEVREEIYDCAYPEMSFEKAMEEGPVPEDVCVANLRSTIEWYEERSQRPSYNEAAEKRRWMDEKIAKRLRSALKHKFDVEVM